MNNPKSDIIILGEIENIGTLIAKDLVGCITPDEFLELSVWHSKSEENKRLRKRFDDPGHFHKQISFLESIDLKAIWRSLIQDI